MSLLTDKDSLVLQLRLAYLRRVDDHVGPRVLSVPHVVNRPRRTARDARDQRERARGDESVFASSLGIQGVPRIVDIDRHHQEERDETGQDAVLPAYAADSPVVIAGLNDAKAYPELGVLYSPKLTSDIPLAGEAVEPAGSSSSGDGGRNAGSNPFLATSKEMTNDEHRPRDSARPRSTSLDASNALSYTTTIYGAGRTGALGMRVSGRHKDPADSRRRRAAAAARIGEELGMANGDSSGDRSAFAPLDPSGQSARHVPTLEKELLHPVSGQSRSSTSAETACKEDDQRLPQIPALSVQSSTYDFDDGRRLSKRSASLCIPSTSDAPALSTIAGQAGKLRSQSSSQPHRPGFPSTLSSASISAASSSEQHRSAGADASEHSLSLEEEKSLVEEGNEDVDEEEDDGNDGGDDGTLRSTIDALKTAPPLRPPRKPRTSISERSIKSTSAVTSGNTVELPEPIDGRRRSRSEAIMPGSMPLLDFTADSAREKSHSGLTSSDTAALPALPSTAFMGRTDSESTLFSLASPLVSRRRGMSIRSQYSDGSVPSLDASTGERQPPPAFEPVAEDQEMIVPLPQRPSTGVPQPATDVMTASARGRASSDPREAKRKIERATGEFGLSPLDHTSADGEGDGRGQDFDESSMPAPSSSIPDAAPTLVALTQSEREAFVPPSVPTAVSPTTAGVSVMPTRATAKMSGGVGRTAPTIFAKADASSVKRQFDNRSNASALTALISNRSEGPNNPFNQSYKSVAGSSVSSGGSTLVEVFFPFASRANPALDSKPRSGALVLHPAARSMRLSVRKDATMEELIGYSLYCYVEEDWRPRLDEALPTDASDEQRDIRLSTVAWMLRIVEDGEVDDDYPAVDRSLTVGKFGADELAICEATAAQVRQNQAASSLLDRRVSRQRQMSTGLATPHRTATIGRPSTLLSSTSRQPSTATARAPPPNSLSTLHPGSPVTAAGVRDHASPVGIPPGTIADGSGRPYLASGAPIFLRILVTPNPDVRYKTTLQVTSDHYLADVLETICKRRELGATDKWAFTIADKDIVVPLDRTVESLQGNCDLALVRRQDLKVQHSSALTKQSTNPNASIFKRISRPDRMPFQTAAKEAAPVYKSYTVNRRLPTFLGRHERVLTIDGDWLHIIPTDARAHTTTTTSYPISSIVSCVQSRLPSTFKLIIMRESNQKRYDFEAESSKASTEIVQQINELLRRK